MNTLLQSSSIKTTLNIRAESELIKLYSSDGAQECLTAEISADDLTSDNFTYKMGLTVYNFT